jgi:hypothetical protein
MILGLWTLGLAAAWEESVILPAADGVDVDWTRLVLVAHAEAHRRGTEGRNAVEELARREIQAAMEQGARRLPVTSDQNLGELAVLPALAESIASRMTAWVVTEARYRSQGGVELDAELQLADLLKPYTLATALAQPDAPEQPRYTGLIVDARGTDAHPAWMPRLLGPDGEVLRELVLWEDNAVSSVPVAYVYDPAHPATLRVGEDPMFVVADSAQGADVVLASQDAVRFRTALTGASILGEGTVVIVVRR